MSSRQVSFSRLFAVMGSAAVLALAVACDVGEEKVVEIGDSFQINAALSGEQLPTTPTTSENLHNDGNSDTDLAGTSVDVSGNTVAVGALGHGTTGKVNVYLCNGTCTQQQEIVPTNPTGGVYQDFGESVAISGDYMIVGDSQYDVTGATPYTNAGRIAFYERSGSVWTQVKTNNPLVANTGYGKSVAISGNRALVGASTWGSRGTVEVWERSISTFQWTKKTTWTMSTGTAGDAFGSAVAISGDIAVVGSSSFDNGTTVNVGRAHVFVRRAAGTWPAVTAPTATLILSTPTANDYFGTSVAVSGRTVVVGVPGADPQTKSAAGAAYVYSNVTGTWALQGIALTNTIDGTAGDEFGKSVGIDDDTIVVGSWKDARGSTVGAGSGLLFKWDDEVKSWTALSPKVQPTTLTANANMGVASAVNGTRAVFGAPGMGGSNGAFYVTDWFEGQQQKLTLSGAVEIETRYGASVDIDGNRMIIGAASYKSSDTTNPPGAVFVVDGCVGAVCNSPVQLPVSDGTGGLAAILSLGSAVAVSGDYAIVGAPLWVYGLTAHDGGIREIRRLSRKNEQDGTNIRPAFEYVAHGDTDVCSYLNNPDGFLLSDISLCNPKDVATLDGGGYLIADNDHYVIRHVLSNGVTRTFAGTGFPTSVPEGTDIPRGPATTTAILNPYQLAVSPDGRVYFISDEYDARENRVMVVKGSNWDEGTIPSKDGRYLYDFNDLGLHTFTRDALTGQNVYSFEYTTEEDDCGPALLESITDAYGQVTSIEHENMSNPMAPTAIVNPKNQTVQLQTDANGFLSSVMTPEGFQYSMEYDAEGLMREYWDPTATSVNDYYSVFTYDPSSGRLLTDAHANFSPGVTQRFTGFDRSLESIKMAPGGEEPEGYYYKYLSSDYSSAEGMETSYRNESRSYVDRFGGERYYFEVTLANLLTRQSIWEKIGESVTTYEDGTEITTITNTDIRLREKAPFMTQFELKTPGPSGNYTDGEEISVVRTQTANLSALSD